jgi:hypothetical protein
MYIYIFISIVAFHHEYSIIYSYLYFTGWRGDCIWIIGYISYLTIHVELGY